jgi:hypothetical protein
VDEPDRGLALALQKNMATDLAIFAMIKHNQVIASTHSRYFMTVADNLYSVEHGKFFDNVDEFLEAHMIVRK